MSSVGGQAVLEGVMMRGPGNWAVAVRTPNGEIAHVARPVVSQMAKHRFFRLPVIRGVMALGESLAIGFRALAISANYAAQEEGEEGEEPATELSRGALFFAFAVAIGFAVVLFKVTPGLLTELLPIKSGGWFVIVEGLIRVAIFDSTVCATCAMSPLGVRTATAQFPGPRIITPSRTACPPTLLILVSSASRGGRARRARACAGSAPPGRRCP